MPDQPPTQEWLTLAEACGRLQRTESTLARWARTGRIEARHGSHAHGALWMVSRQSVEALEAELQDWVSFDDALVIVDCSKPTLERAVAAGEIDQRKVNRSWPSLRRSTLEAFAETWRERQEATARERAERAERPAEPRESAPPDDGEVWLSVPEVAALMRVHRNRVLRLVHEERMPAVRRGRQWWVRRDHAEQVAAARSLTRRRSSLRASDRAPHQSSRGGSSREDGSGNRLFVMIAKSPMV